MPMALNKSGNNSFTHFSHHCLNSILKTIFYFNNLMSNACTSTFLSLCEDVQLIKKPLKMAYIKGDLNIEWITPTL